VRYRLHTLILVVREDLATGAGSKVVPLGSSDGGGVMSGRTVDRASGSRRVRKSVEDWRYVLEILDEDGWRAEDTEDESDDIEVAKPCEDDDEKPLEAIIIPFCS